MDVRLEGGSRQGLGVADRQREFAELQHLLFACAPSIPKGRDSRNSKPMLVQVYASEVVHGRPSPPASGSGGPAGSPC